MRFTIAIADFQRILQKTMPALAKKSTLPILEHLDFTLSGTTLKVIATDQDITIMSSIEVSAMDDGSVLVPGRKINDVIKALSGTGYIEFSSDPENFDIKVKTSTGKYSMKGLDPKEFLELPELFEYNSENISKVSHDEEDEEEDDDEDYNADYDEDDDDEDEESEKVVGKLSFTKDENQTAYLDQKIINGIAEKTVFAVSTDEYRPAMNGVLMQFRGNVLNAVATDSFRLVKNSIKSEEETFPKELDIIVPARALDLLKKADSDVMLSVLGSKKKYTHVRFDVGNTVIISRLINERFPPYESVIPQNNDLKTTVERVELLSAIRRVSILTSKVSHQVRFRLEKEQITIIGEDEDAGDEAREVINCSYDDKNFEIGFNCKYLEEALENISLASPEEDQVLMCFSEPTRPAILIPANDSDSLLMLIMPVRINS